MPTAGFYITQNSQLSSSIPKIRQEGGFQNIQSNNGSDSQHNYSSVHSHSWRDFNSSLDLSDTFDSFMHSDNHSNHHHGSNTNTNGQTNWINADPFANFNQHQPSVQQQQPQLFNLHHQNVQNLFNEPHSPLANNNNSDDLNNINLAESPYLQSQPYPRRNSMIRDSSRSRYGVGKAPSSRSRASRASISGPAPQIQNSNSNNNNNNNNSNNSNNNVAPVPAQAIFIPSSAPPSQQWGHSFPGTVPNNDTSNQRRLSLTDYNPSPSSLPHEPLMDDNKQSESVNERRRRRRESHNAVERRRRDNINERIAELATLLPDELLLDVGPPNARTNKQQQNNSDITPLSPAKSSLPTDFGRLATLDETSVADLSQQSPNPQSTPSASHQKQQAVAAAAAGKPNKGVILRKSVEYIRYLQQIVEVQSTNAREMEVELEYYRKLHPSSIGPAQHAKNQFIQSNSIDFNSGSSPQGLLLSFDKFNNNNNNHNNNNYDQQQSNSNDQQDQQQRQQMREASAVSGSAISDGSEDVPQTASQMQPIVKTEDLDLKFDFNPLVDYNLDFGHFDYNQQQHHHGMGMEE